MTISTGNYRTRMGVNQIAFPAQTVDGEKVIIEEKITRANQSTLLVSEDGRVFESDAQYSQKLRELGEDAKAALMDEYESVREAVQGRLPELMADAKEALSELVEIGEDAVEDLAAQALDKIDEAQEALGDTDDADDRLVDQGEPAPEEAPASAGMGEVGKSDLPNSDAPVHPDELAEDPRLEEQPAMNDGGSHAPSEEKAKEIAADLREDEDSGDA